MKNARNAARTGAARFFVSIAGRLFRRAPTVPVVRLSGAIGMGSPLRPGMTLAGLGPVIERAFAVKGAAAVALVINSPGGSPVQSALIHNRIRTLAERNERKVFTFCEDVAASGGYYLALAGDEIHADVSSIVGSIGVVSAGFGFVEAIGKLGVERRVYTAGESKSRLDPFKPEKPEDVAHLRAIQEDVHDSFKTVVRNRRGARLKGDDKELFSGNFWSGRQALEIGLIDGLGDIDTIMRERFGDKVRLRPMGPSGGWLRRRFSAPPGMHGAERAPTLAEDILATIETRALWSRFGL